MATGFLDELSQPLLNFTHNAVRSMANCRYLGKKKFISHSEFLPAAGHERDRASGVQQVEPDLMSQFNQQVQYASRRV
jgi:hypothetical protein